MEDIKKERKFEEIEKKKYENVKCAKSKKNSKKKLFLFIEVNMKLLSKKKTLNWRQSQQMKL